MDTHINGAGLLLPERPEQHEVRPPLRTIKLNLSELRRNGMVTPDDKSSVIAQEYRSIKRSVLSNAREKRSHALTNNLVMVTSSVPGEGKTFSAVNLALSLAAERDIEVVLVDADLPLPNVHTFFGKTEGPGLVDYLDGTVESIPDVMHRCEELPSLAVIFGGKPSPDSPELVSSKRMSTLLSSLSHDQSSRIVVIDTPPVLPFVEAATIAPHVHQLIMVVASLKPSRRQLEKALEAVSACYSISILFNKAPRWGHIENDAYYYYAKTDGGRQ
jgi:receptor protein-tyrosine kinase